MYIYKIYIYKIVFFKIGFTFLYFNGCKRDIRIMFTTIPFIYFLRLNCIVQKDLIMANKIKLPY